MITTGMLKRQIWMADDDEFDRIVKNSERVLKLNAQYQNHPYNEEFTKECSVMFVYGTYILEGEADAKFSLNDIWNLFQKDYVPNNNFCRQMINYESVESTTKNIRSSTEQQDDHANTQNDDGG